MFILHLNFDVKYTFYKRIEFAIHAKSQVILFNSSYKSSQKHNLKINLNVEKYVKKYVENLRYDYAIQ